MKKLKTSTPVGAYEKRAPAIQTSDRAENTDAVSAFTGQIQENYVNPLLLVAMTVNSISNMSFQGAWV